MKIAPGVRVRASSRGLSAGVGPRAARVHVGTRGVGVSSGVGPVSAYSHLGGGRRRSPATSRTAYERELRAQQRAAEVNATRSLVEDFELAYLHVHREHFGAATAPQAPPAADPDRKALRREERRRALKGISWLALSERKAAKVAADAEAEKRAQEMVDEWARARQQLQDELDAAWDRLLANDPEVVLGTLEAAFEDNEAPAAAIGSVGSAISVAMRMPTRDVIVPEKQADVTPTGKPTVKRISKTLRNELHASAVMSHALVTAKEAFAVAPSIDTVTLLVVMDDEVSVQPIYVAYFTRAEFDTVDWSESAATISARLGGWMETKGQAAEVACLPLGGETDLLAVLGQVAEAIGLPVAGQASKAA